MKYLLILILFVSCSKIDNGIIVDKIHEPERHYTYTTTMLVGKMMVPVFHRVHDNEDWIIIVKGETKRGKIVKRPYYVSEYRYDTLHIGNAICVSGECDEDRNNVER